MDQRVVAIERRLAEVRLLAMDVDGVLTDGRVVYDGAGGELKAFHVADGLGLVVLRQCGIQIAWFSGRKHSGVERRAAELGIASLFQGVRDKEAALRSTCSAAGIALKETAYIGDDWNDLPAFRAAGVSIAVANAAQEVKATADWVTERPGGDGAVREVCMAILDARGIREQALRTYLEALKDATGRDRVGQ